MNFWEKARDMQHAEQIESQVRRICDLTLALIELRSEIKCLLIQGLVNEAEKESVTKAIAKADQVIFHKESSGPGAFASALASISERPTS